jgi:hypothetical protein
VARLWSCGFELGSLAIELAGPGNATIEGTTKRSGDYSCKIGTLVSATTQHVVHTFASPAGNGPYYARAYFRFATLPSAENTCMALLSATTIVARITIGSGGALTLYDEDGQIGSASSALSTNTWYRIEMALDATGAGATDTVRGYLDGAEFAGSATRNLSTGVDVIRVGGNLNAEAQTQGEWYIDDLAINDSTVGGGHTGLPGAGGIRHMQPDGAGDDAAGTGTFADIDDVPPDDATSFIVVAGGVGNRANYAFESWANAGGAADDVITLVSVGTRQTAASAVAAQWSCELKSQSAGTLDTGAGKSHDDTTWRTNGDANPRNYDLTSYVDPQGGGAWTPALLNTAIAGVIRNDASPDLHVSALWLLVEFTPAVAGSDVLIQGMQHLHQQFGTQTAVRLGGLLQE